MRANNSESARHWSGLGVTGRLIALVMLPVTVMCGLAGSIVLTHRSTATSAVAVEERVAELSNLLELRDALHTMQAVRAFDVRFPQLGVTREFVVDFIGVDWAPQVAPARALAGRAIVSLGDRSPITAAALQSLYAEIDDGTHRSRFCCRTLR